MRFGVLSFLLCSQAKVVREILLDGQLPGQSCDSSARRLAVRAAEARPPLATVDRSAQGGGSRAVFGKGQDRTAARVVVVPRRGRVEPSDGGGGGGGAGGDPWVAKRPVTGVRERERHRHAALKHHADPSAGTGTSSHVEKSRF